MRQNINWGAVEEAKDFPKVKPGGYICQIRDVEDVEKQEYLKISYDIVDGEFEGHYSKLNATMNYNLPFFIRSYKEKSMPFFKGMLTSLEYSNKGFIADKFNNQPESLIGAYIGLILGEEEYLSNDGEVKTALKVQSVRSTKVIKDGNFEIPKLKKLRENNTAKPQSWQPVDDEELPF